MVKAAESDPLDNPFWQFSLDVYARVGVAPKCLQLQEVYQIDVNLVLFGFWLGHEGWLIPDNAIAQEIAERVSQWRADVIIPLRRYRIDFQPLGKDMPAKQDPLRRQIKRLEIDAEQVEQAMLYELSRQKTLALADNRSAAMVENVIALQPALNRGKPLLEDLAVHAS
jgi:uncharacterized protein (TIGR02444 family)